MPDKDKESKKSVKNLYVIRLDDAVLKLREFRQKNPEYRRGKPCCYVGVTSHDPEVRFRQHKDGHKTKKGYETSSSIVKKYGMYLQRKQFERRPLVPWDVAEECERALAEEL